MSEVWDEIAELFAARGADLYVGEPVTQLEHGLQAAHLAEVAEAPDTLVAAALLHDIGHLLPEDAEGAAAAGIDARHEEAGQAWLAGRFGPAVTEPVRLHVAAKRYLCAVEPAYLATLSPASVHSLGLQGGPMTDAEARSFEANPHYRDAVRLRRWDDEAKIVGLAVPGFDHYRARLETAVRTTDA
jgi:phosphonate degradation associated HDIG domain protein